MNWTVILHPDFEPEFDALPSRTKSVIAAKALVIETFGPQLGRPHVDTLEGSRYTNMNEPRCNADDGIWRVAFTFDPERKAVLLACGDKSGGSEKRFYRCLVAKADERFARHLRGMRGEA